MPPLPASAPITTGMVSPTRPYTTMAIGPSIRWRTASSILDNAGAWGGADSILVPGDYDGDGIADRRVPRRLLVHLLAGERVILNNSGAWAGRAGSGAGDYDGDGKSTWPCTMTAIGPFTDGGRVLASTMPVPGAAGLDSRGGDYDATVNPTWLCITTAIGPSTRRRTASSSTTAALGAGRAGTRCRGIMTATANPIWPRTMMDTGPSISLANASSSTTPAFGADPAGRQCRGL